MQKLFIPISQALVILMLASQAHAAETKPTLAQRLGAGADEKLLILHADDLGIVDSSNTAAEDLYAAGLVKSGSIMTQGPAADVAFKKTSEVFKGDLGIHISLTGEGAWTPAAGADKVPSIVDSVGFLFDSPLRLVAWARKGDVFREIKAQIEKSISAGLMPSHMDTHLGEVFFKQNWLYSYLNIARAYKIPPMVPRWTPELASLAGPAASALGWVVTPLLAEVENAGFLQVDYLYIYPFPQKDEGYEARKKKYVDLLKNLKPGVNEILFHPAYDSEQYRKLLAFNPTEHVRLHEALIFRDPEIRALIESQHIRLIGWKEINSVYPWDQVKALGTGR